MTTTTKGKDKDGGKADPKGPGPDAGAGNGPAAGADQAQAATTGASDTAGANAHAQAPAAEASPAAVVPAAAVEQPKTEEQEAEYIANASDRDVELAKRILRARGIDVVDDDEAADEIVANEPPVEIQGQPGAEILMDACAIYGINPDQKALPRELLAWKYYPADRELGLPESVRLVTAGGVKLRHYADGLIDEKRDPDTATILRAKLRLFRMDPTTRQMTPLPFSGDLTLPDEAVSGQVGSDAHVYREGYLRSGGRTEATRREQAAVGDVFRPTIRRRIKGRK